MADKVETFFSDYANCIFDYYSEANNFAEETLMQCELHEGNFNMTLFLFPTEKFYVIEIRDNDDNETHYRCETMEHALQIISAFQMAALS